jgi:hypothetical protein
MAYQNYPPPQGTPPQGTPPQKRCPNCGRLLAPDAWGCPCGAQFWTYPQAPTPPPERRFNYGPEWFVAGCAVAFLLLIVSPIGMVAWVMFQARFQGH